MPSYWVPSFFRRTIRTRFVLNCEGYSIVLKRAVIVRQASIGNLIRNNRYSYLKYITEWPFSVIAVRSPVRNKDEDKLANRLWH